METRPALSVLIPFFNEEGNVHPVIDEVHEQLSGIAFEVICVNDCSADATAAELAEVKAKHPDTVIVLNHVARRGKSAALFTGLKSARGEWVQLLDGDGQNDPADTARLWKEIIQPGAPARLGIIAGKRNSRNDSGFKWVQSRVANGVRRFVLRDDATDTGCGWKLIRTAAFRDLPFFASMHRFLPALIKRAGWDVREERVNDRKRLAGQSKYGFLGRLGAGMFDLIGMFWLTRRGGYGIAREWNDPRA
ncbi:glycosyltransferase family 2 protein [Hyphomonas pacifica]|uniref:Glycosyl transferase family 2 n=1 Tax=Hyphomonas pacifica TaxID=1280941 RepID=A0A062TZ89_9PROT|nr:glycosyltransferase family 2 protein [Hyphomonas pacifica]KCZ46188.1 glycosyl transferase family 2 [Hyphomonas pacifica]RAN31535.1 glycosyl transferase family 2 [Hyphomonas pacifica]RAN35790.1 glycosyl transferase family 2 [Hyphomonas pacifica]